jgi:hypothetical protein
VVSAEQIAWAAETACEMLGELATKETWPFEREIAPELVAKVTRYVNELF